MPASDVTISVSAITDKTYCIKYRGFSVLSCEFPNGEEVAQNKDLVLRPHNIAQMAFTYEIEENCKCKTGNLHIRQLLLGPRLFCDGCESQLPFVSSKRILMPITFCKECNRLFLFSDRDIDRIFEWVNKEGLI